MLPIKHLKTIEQQYSYVNYGILAQALCDGPCAISEKASDMRLGCQENVLSGAWIPLCKQMPSSRPCANIVGKAVTIQQP
jgi:hypothetical protein